MTSGHVEVERKYDVDGGFVLPDPADLAAAGIAAADPPVEHSLEAVYHDTADLRLARARITLRRRTGGSDAGWHLKLPGEGGARRELHAPLGRAVENPPPALLDPVRGILRGAPTAPVATLRNHRVVTVLRDGEGRAAGRGRRRHGHRQRLRPRRRGGAAGLAGGGGRAPRRRRGAAGAGRGVAGRRGCPRRRTRRRSSAGCCRPGSLPRPATEPAERADRRRGRRWPRSAARSRRCRRPTSTCASTHPTPSTSCGSPPGGCAASSRPSARCWTARPPSRSARSSPGWAGSWARPATTRSPWPTSASWWRSSRRSWSSVRSPPGCSRRRIRSAAAGREQALATLASERYLRLLDALHALLDDPPFASAAGGPGAAGVPRRGAQGRGSGCAAGSGRRSSADGDARDVALHEVRKAAKRLRYTAEVGALGPGKPPKKLVKAAKRVQKALGDAAGHRRHARACAGGWAIEAAAAGENAFTFGHAARTRGGPRRACPGSVRRPGTAICCRRSGRRCAPERVLTGNAGRLSVV